jgi:long-subunit fatty acid transport protein
MKIIFTLIILTIFQFNGFSQSKLNAVKSEIKSEKTTSTVSKATATLTHVSQNHYVSQNEGAIIDVLFQVSMGLFIGDYNSESHLYHPLSAYPFNKKIPGNYVEDDNDSKYTQFRIDVSNQFMGGNSIYVNHLKVKIRPTHIFDIQTDYTEFMEPQTTESGPVNLSIFNFSLCHDRLRFEKFNLGWTVGVLYIPNSINETGGNLGLQMEYFFDTKISLLSAAKWGWINETNIYEFEASARYHINRGFISGVYERRLLGSSVIHLGGIGAGIYL